MEPDPHDEYYARQQLHREELSDWFGLGADRDDKTVRRILVIATVLLLGSCSALAHWMGFL